MKVVMSVAGTTEVRSIEEKDFFETIEWIKSSFKGRVQKPLAHELFRYKTDNGVIIVYKDNKRVRTSNTWVEIRALTALSKLTKLRFEHSVKFVRGYWNTEVDGVNWDEKVMVEVRYGKISQKWVEYYEKKREKLGFKKCIIIATNLDENVKGSKNVELYRLKLDFKTAHSYYSSVRFPEWVRELIPSRHIRFLLPNGVWTGIRKKLSKTAKYTVEEKFKKQLFKFARKGRMPIKIYYSMARMVNPVSEYVGKGYPMPFLLLVFDVDVSAKRIIDDKGYYENFFDNAEKLAKIVEEKLQERGYKTKKLFSGLKGFHVYGLKNDKVCEVKPEEMIELTYELADYVDNVRFKGSSGFDMHRIIKLPSTVDLATGIVVTENFKRLDLKDKLVKLD